MDFLNLHTHTHTHARTREYQHYNFDCYADCKRFARVTMNILSNVLSFSFSLLFRFVIYSYHNNLALNCDAKI